MNEEPIYREAAPDENLQYIYSPDDQEEAWLVYDSYGILFGSLEPLPIDKVWDFRAFPSREAALKACEEVYGGLQNGWSIKQISKDGS